MAVAESLRTHRFKNALKAAAGNDAVYIKHSDRITAGIPDSTLTLAHTIWLEFKVRTRSHVGRPFEELLKTTNRKAKIQMFLLWRLARVNGGRAFYVVFEPSGGVSLVRVRSPFHQTFEHVVTDSQERIVNTLIALCQ